MILSSDSRRQKLSEIRENGEKQGRQKLFYRGETQSFDVYRIDLDYLIYNRHNGRLEAEMLTWEQENAAAPDEYTAELHKLIDDLLWQSNAGRNKQTLIDLAEKGQQRPGIVSLDGVVIDGNRRTMLLRRLQEKKNTKQYLDAVILPDSYADNQTEIVRLETQYQLGEDSKVEYGPLQKYLHARRLKDLDIDEAEIDKLMGEKPGYAKRLLAILALMDDYLEHIGCPRLYTMLRDSDGTKEGMFVDLYADLRRLGGNTPGVAWPFDPEVDLMDLRLIQFDYIRHGDFADAKKVYREISHQSSGNNFFAKQQLWEAFRENHQAQVDPITSEMGTLEEFIAANPGQYETKVDAARARDGAWSKKISDPMKSNFGQVSHKLGLDREHLKPGEYLKRAKDLLERIDFDHPALLAGDNRQLVIDINRLTYEIKKKFDRASSPGFSTRISA